MNFLLLIVKCVFSCKAVLKIGYHLVLQIKLTFFFYFPTIASGKYRFVSSNNSDIVIQNQPFVHSQIYHLVLQLMVSYNKTLHDLKCWNRQ
jgi:hypothetical protein